jgi:hypothetical protein
MLRRSGVAGCLTGYSTNPKEPLLKTYGLPSNQQRLFFWGKSKEPENDMQPDDELILRVSKEIIIKFIELGRVSPTNFEENFKSVFWTLKNTVVDAQLPDVESILRGDESGD